MIPSPTASEAYDASEDCPTNPATDPSYSEILAARLSRRDLIKGLAGVAGALAASPLAALAATAAAEPSAAPAAPPAPPAEPAAGGTARFAFEEVAHGVDETHHVAPGYRADVLIRWGDPVVPGGPVFDPERQSAEAQAKQFGYNNDFVGYIPLPLGSDNSEHGLLCVNHEYTDEEVMFPAALRESREGEAARARVEIEMACHGGSILEVVKENGRWRVVADSPYARRIDALTTEIAISGPAAGHPRLKTSADPSGRRVIGTVNNCAGGITPWGTYLMAEENFHGYFAGDPDPSCAAPGPAAKGTERCDGESNPAEGTAPPLGPHPERANYLRYGVGEGRYAWGRFHKRFDIQAEPNEANRFGWIVEVDPFDPAAPPVKRTALGRLKHEGAESIVNPDGRLVLYTGDDQQHEYLYKFVSARPVDPGDRTANRDLLDEGTLYAARFHADGTLTWLPLLYGWNGLDPSNDFTSQADVLIETRRAASVLGATPMDRPEDMEPNPKNGRVYVMLTNNSKRATDRTDGANPRGPNLWGHILELTPPNGDHAAITFRWDILLLAGNPADPAVAAAWGPDTSPNGWFACPDNCAVDPAGRLWVATDQGSAWKRASGTADGIWAVATEGPTRGSGRMFFRVPVGAEMCGPRFTPDGRTLFLAVQHPGTDGTRDYPGFARPSTYEDPATRWPDFDPRMPPRPSVVVVTREDGGPIGG